MGIPSRLVVACAWLLAGVTDASAQPVAAQPTKPEYVDEDTATLSPERERELTAWLTAMKEWRRFDARWSNRPARDKLGRITARPPVPPFPEWLPAHCATAERAGVLDLQARTRLACRLLQDPRAPADSASPQVQTTRLEAERPPKRSMFLTRVHLDGLWTTTSSGRSYGIIGSHLSLVDVGRLQVFGPPGVLLLTVPQGDGSRRMELGYTWGLSIRLTDVRLLGSKEMTLFMNVSKVWLSGGGSSDIVGLSLAPRARSRR